MNTTTQTFARVSRQSGTEYAASIERSLRTDWDGMLIAAAIGVVIACLVVWRWMA